MGENYRRGGALPDELTQPQQRAVMEDGGIGWPQAAILRTHTNTIIVFHRVVNGAEHARMGTEELKIGPERATQEAAPGDVDGVVIEERDVKLRCPRPQCIGELRNGLPVVFVIAGYVDDRMMRIRRASPLEASNTAIDVTGQRDNICLHVRRTLAVELAMEVAEDVEARQRQEGV